MVARAMGLLDEALGTKDTPLSRTQVIDAQLIERGSTGGGGRNGDPAIP